MVREEQERLQAEAAERQARWAQLPPAIRAALEAGDPEGYAAARDQLSPAEREAFEQQLQDAGLMSADDLEKDKRMEQLFSTLPPAVRAAIEARDLEALQAALDQLPQEQAETAVQQLQEAGILGAAESEMDPEELLAQLPPAVRAAVEAQDLEALNTALAQLPPAEREAVEQQLEELWAVKANPQMEEILASLPPAVRAALDGEDDDALEAALDDLPPEQADDIVNRLIDLGLIMEEPDDDE